MLIGFVAVRCALGGVMTIALGPIGLIVLAIAGLIAIVILVIKHWDQLKRDTFYTWNLIRDFFIGFWDNVISLFRTRWGILLAVLFPAVGIPLLIAAHWDPVVEYFKDLWAKVTEIFNWIGESIWSPIKTAVEAVISFLQPVIDAIQKELAPISERAQVYLDDPTLVRNIIADGNDRARKLASETMRDVRESMGLDYS